MRRAKDMATSTKTAFTITGLALLLVVSGLGNCLLNRCRRRLKAMITARTASVPGAGIATTAQSGKTCFQWKAELDDEESKLCELAAEEKRHEIGAYVERFELPADERWNKTWDRQELQGEEYSKELEALHHVRGEMLLFETPVNPV